MTLSSKRILVFDPLIAGVAGDMIVAALIDLGANLSSVVEAMQSTQKHLQGCKKLEISISDTSRNGIRAKKVDVNAQEGIVSRSSTDLIDSARSCLTEIDISEDAKVFAMTALNSIISAEASIHGQKPEEIHLHELASVDTLADIVGTAAALDDLDCFSDTKIFSTPVAVGGGSLRLSHGIVSSPAPATLEILRSHNFPTVGGPVEAELATPTGVALLTSLVPEFINYYPSMKPVLVGYGAGTKEFGEVPNVLRVTIGESNDSGLISDEVLVIETNIDDTTGEVIGHAMDRLLQEGARDVSAIPTLSKKGRPGHILSVITDRAIVEHLCSVLIGETGSLGVRILPCERRLLFRENFPVEIVVANTKEVVNIKVARRTDGQVVRIKPEYDDLVKLADKTGKPLRELDQLTIRKAWEVLHQ